MKHSLYFVFYFLFVLSFSTVYAQKNDYPNTTTINGKEYYLYEVQKSEGLYRISQKLGISQEEIIAHNPEVVSGLHAGQVLRIPVKETAKTQLDTIFTNHSVEQGQTLYFIARQYNVSVETIVKYNPEAANTLKSGTVLRIPIETKEKSLISPEQKKPKEIVSTTKEPNIVVQKKEFTKNENKDKIKIALLLPFMLESEKQDATIDKFIEFYEGCLIAINKLKNEGASIDLYTFDTEKSEEKIYQILNNDALKKVDLIIGPAYSNQVNIVADFALENKINVVIPFSSKVDDVNKNPYVFQNNSPQKKRFAETAKGFANQFKNKNIIICNFNNDIDDEGSEFGKYLSAYLKKQQITYHDFMFNQENSVDFSSLLVTNKENILLLATDKQEVVQDMTTIINVLNTKTTPISVFGFSGWQSSLKSFLDVYVSSPFYITPNSEETKKYNQEFRHWFGHEITTSFPRFDMMGYDLTLYFGEAIRKYRGNFGDMLPVLEVKTIQSDFSFEKQNGGGYINNRFWFIRYNQEKGIEKIKIQ